MKTFINIFAVFIVLLPGISTRSQQWSAEQKEVWATVEAYNNMSVTRDVGFIDYFDDSYSGWEYESETPENKEAVIKMLSNLDPNYKTLYILLTPATIWVNGNFAYVHYYYTVLREDKEGKRSREKGRWTDILMKKNGKWIMVGDHGGQVKN